MKQEILVYSLLILLLTVTLKTDRVFAEQITNEATKTIYIMKGTLDQIDKRLTNVEGQISAIGSNVSNIRNEMVTKGELSKVGNELSKVSKEITTKSEFAKVRDNVVTIQNQMATRPELQKVSDNMQKGFNRLEDRIWTSTFWILGSIGGIIVLVASLVGGWVIKILKEMTKKGATLSAT